MRQRPAPSANRTAISLRRFTARASNMLATFAQATSNTKLTTVIRTPTIISVGVRPWGGTIRPHAATTATLRPPGSSGPELRSRRSWWSLAAIRRTAACAEPRLASGRRRPNIINQPSSDEVSVREPELMTGSKLSGTHRSGGAMTVAPANLSGITPTIVYGCWLRLTLLPTMPASELKRWRHSE